MNINLKILKNDLKTYEVIIINLGQGDDYMTVYLLD